MDPVSPATLGHRRRATEIDTASCCPRSPKRIRRATDHSKTSKPTPTTASMPFTSGSFHVVQRFPVNTAVTNGERKHAPVFGNLNGSATISSSGSLNHFTTVQSLTIASPRLVNSQKIEGALDMRWKTCSESSIRPSWISSVDGIHSGQTEAEYQGSSADAKSGGPNESSRTTLESNRIPSRPPYTDNVSSNYNRAAMSTISARLLRDTEEHQTILGGREESLVRKSSPHGVFAKENSNYKPNICAKGHSREKIQGICNSRITPAAEARSAVIGSPETPNDIHDVPSSSYDGWDPEFVNILEDIHGESFGGEQGVSMSTVVRTSDGDGDNYSVCQSDEDAMAILAGSNLDSLEHYIPPSSVVEEFDIASRSEARFDPSLQRSSPSAPNTPGNAQHIKPHDNLLDDDVDWNEILRTARRGSVVVETSSEPSFDTLRGLVKPRRSLNETALQTSSTVFSQLKATINDTSQPCSTTYQRQTLSRALKSPASPSSGADPWRATSPADSPIMPGMWTSFRLGEMLNLNARRVLQGQKETIFELFAVVTYSMRDMSSRTQIFQFRDLYTDRPPYLNGNLQGWTAGGLLDGSSGTFLAKTGKARLCRCVCRLRREAKVITGWVAVIQAIREVTWEDVEKRQHQLGHHESVSHDAGD
jgi:hypothetical protein